MQKSKRGRKIISDKALLALLGRLEEKLKSSYAFSDDPYGIPEDLLIKDFLYDFAISILRDRING